MMTVKHIALSGEEFVYPTTHVNFVPGAIQDKEPGKPAPRDAVWFYADGQASPLIGGTVFVMNDHGKTVARYDIGASMVPLAG